MVNLVNVLKFEALWTFKILSPKSGAFQRCPWCCDWEILQADPKQMIMAGPHTPFRIESHDCTGLGAGPLGGVL